MTHTYLPGLIEVPQPRGTYLPGLIEVPAGRDTYLPGLIEVPAGRDTYLPGLIERDGYGDHRYGEDAGRVYPVIVDRP